MENNRISEFPIFDPGFGFSDLENSYSPQFTTKQLNRQSAKTPREKCSEVIRRHIFFLQRERLFFSSSALYIYKYVEFLKIWVWNEK